MCLIVWLYGLVRSSRLVVFWGLLLRGRRWLHGRDRRWLHGQDRRWLHGQAGTYAQLSALVAAPIGIDAAMRLARREVYKWSSASRRRRESHPTMRRRWTIVEPIIVPIVLICRTCKRDIAATSAAALKATDSVLAAIAPAISVASTHIAIATNAVATVSVNGPCADTTVRPANQSNALNIRSWGKWGERDCGRGSCRSKAAERSKSNKCGFEFHSFPPVEDVEH
jgi:hypothetical protein